MLTKNQVAQVVKLLQQSSVANLSHIAHGLATNLGTELATEHLDQLSRFVGLPRAPEMGYVLVELKDPSRENMINCVKIIRTHTNAFLQDAKKMFDLRQIRVPAELADALVRDIQALGIQTSTKPVA